MRAATSLLPRKRLEFQVWLDMPVGLTPPKVTPAGSERAIVFAGTVGQVGPESRADGTLPGWLVLLGIRNRGSAPIRSADFSDPLAFTFPGREVLAAWLCDVPAVSGAAPHPGYDNQGRVRLVGDFLLRPKDAYTIVVMLSGTPTAGSRPVYQDGTLTTGRVASPSCR